jgi:hypothetical protein
MMSVDINLKIFKERAMEYRRETKRLIMLIDGDLQRGDAFLNSAIKKLYEYSDI